MRRNAIILAILVVSIGLYLVYKNLGGDQEIVYTVEQRGFRVMGQSYDGSYRSKEIEGLFRKAKKVAEQENLQVVVVNYGSDDEAATIKQFIGVLLMDGTMTESDDGYELITFDSQQVISAKINAHNFVMPKPEKVREGAQKLATEKGVELGQTTLEVYISDRELTSYFLSDM